MKSEKIKIRLIWGAAMFIASCKGGGDEVYPSVITEFATMQTDAEGTITCLTTDDEHTYTLSNPQQGYVRDTLYRAVCGFVPDGDAATLYSASGAYLLHDSTALASPAASDAAPAAAGATSSASDPVRPVSVWRSGRYINMQLAPLTQGGRQYWGYRIDSIRSRTTHLSLHHRQNGDPLSYTQTVYASLPLDSLTSVPAGDSIALHILSFTGPQVWMFQRP